MEDILTRAHLATNAGLRKCKEIDDTLSGTTSISLLLHGSTMYFSNLGDSRAVLVSLASNASTSSSSPADSGRLVAKAMSSDQTPYRKDERERVKKYGARVMTMEQIEGNAPLHENWGDLELGNEIDEGGDPPRIWSPQGDYPGTAFTRSIGDFFAEGLGVVAEPEFTVLDLSPQDKYIIIASDGVFEFLTNQMTADMIVTPDNLLNVCRAVVEVSYGLWLQYEYRTDDITIILIAIDQLTSLPTNVRTIRPKQTLSIKTNSSNDPDMNLNSNSPRVMTSRPIRRRPKKKFMILNSADDADANDGVVVPFSEPKTPQEAQSIRNAIQSNFLFQNIGASQRNAIIDAMVKVEVDADEVVILQGDKGDRFYIVERGRYEVRMKTEDGRPAPDDGRATHFKFGIYGQWRHEYTTANNTHPCFGELSLMYGKPRGATVIALEPGVLWALDRKDFRNLLLRSISSRRRILDNLRRVKILRCLDVSDIQRLADVLSENTFPAGSTIIEQGTPGDNFYMIIEGKCRVTVKGEEGAKKAKAEVINRLGEWEYFGERALLSNEPHSCNVIADTDVKVHYINKASFDEVLNVL